MSSVTRNAHLAAVANGASDGDLAVMLTGGGARAAYQVGLLKGLAAHFPALRFQIVTGVSAGAINAVYLAAKRGGLPDKVAELESLWCELECDHIFHFNLTRLLSLFTPLATVFPRKSWSRPRGLVDNTPLSILLQHLFDARPGEPIRGITENIDSGMLNAVSLITLDYSTGQSVRWVQGRNIDLFEGPNRRSAETEITVEHVLASSALPFIFPAVRIGSRWYGDGGIRLSSPLSAAVHLGATRIIAMSTGYHRTPDEARKPAVQGYPPAAQILGQLNNAVFLDVVDEDVERMQRMNDLLRHIDPRDRDGFRPIDLLVLRPSQDLGKLASDYEKYLPRNVKLLTRALGARETNSSDFLSLLMFEPNYTRRLVEIGAADVASRLDEIRSFLTPREEPRLAAI